MHGIVWHDIYDVLLFYSAPLNTMDFQTALNASDDRDEWYVYMLCWANNVWYNTGQYIWHRACVRVLQSMCIIVYVYITFGLLYCIKISAVLFYIYIKYICAWMNA